MLHESDWWPPETRRSEELQLSKRVATHLVKTGRFRYLEPADGVSKRVVVPDNPAWLSVEHPIADAAGRGHIDILLVDTRARTLLAIEVKLRATLAPSREPVHQVIRYGNALTKQHGSKWGIRRLVVAEHFDEAVIELAASHDVEYRVCSGGRGDLRPSLD